MISKPGIMRRLFIAQSRGNPYLVSWKPRTRRSLFVTTCDLFCERGQGRNPSAKVPRKMGLRYSLTYNSCARFANRTSKQAGKFNVLISPTIPNPLTLQLITLV